MKVLVISHHREKSGWGNACRDFIKALNKYVEVVSRPIVFNPQDVDEEILKTEKNTLAKTTHVVQYLLPKHFSYLNEFEKSVGISLFETVNIPLDLKTYLELNKEFWNFNMVYPYHSNQKDLFQAFESKKIAIPKMNIDQLNGYYKFLFVGECIKRKNLHTLLKAYYSTFLLNEPVCLLIKTSLPGKSKAETNDYLNNMIMQIQDSCKLHKNRKDYPRVELLLDHMDDGQLYSLYNYSDCYVNVSFGESICYPMLEAAHFNKPIITTGNKYSSLIGVKQIINTELEPCYGQVHTFPQYNSSREFWYSPKITSIMDHLYQAYISKLTHQEYDLSKLSYENAGKIYIDQLLS